MLKSRQGFSNALMLYEKITLKCLEKYRLLVFKGKGLILNIR